MHMHVQSASMLHLWLVYCYRVQVKDMANGDKVYHPCMVMRRPAVARREGNNHNHQQNRCCS
jgi:hypothetical protein